MGWGILSNERNIKTIKKNIRNPIPTKCFYKKKQIQDLAHYLKPYSNSCPITRENAK